MWAEKYLGLPYGEYNCAELVQLALKEQYDYDLILPQLPSKAAEMHRTIMRQKELYKITDSPIDGTIVIMRMNGRMSHIGLYCVGKGMQNYILHAVQSTKHTILTSEKNLSRMAIKIMEFREWR